MPVMHLSGTVPVTIIFEPYNNFVNPAFLIIDEETKAQSQMPES